MAGENVFGYVVEGAAYKTRPAAYALIRGAERQVAVIKTRRGYFLPGGGSDDGESPEQTVSREVREELGREVRIIRKANEAIQYFSDDEKYYRLEATFFEAEFEGEATGAAEYELVWAGPATAEEEFFHQCHWWAISRFVTRS